MKKITVAVVGLSVGMEFVPIYREHPGVNKVYVCDFSKDLLETAKMRYDIPEECCTEEFESLLSNPEIDAIHIVTPPATHADYSVKVLNAGKHCARPLRSNRSLQRQQVPLQMHSCSHIAAPAHLVFFPSLPRIPLSAVYPRTSNKRRRRA